jgi:hypothetical protein
MGHSVITVYYFFQKLCIIPSGYTKTLPTPVAAPPKVWVCGRSIVGIMLSNPAEGMDVSLL